MTLSRMTIGVGTLSIYIHLDKKIWEATEHGAQHHYRIFLSTMGHCWVPHSLLKTIWSTDFCWDRYNKTCISLNCWTNGDVIASSTRKMSLNRKFFDQKMWNPILRYDTQNNNKKYKKQENKVLSDILISVIIKLCWAPWSIWVPHLLFKNHLTDRHLLRQIEQNM